MRISCLCGEDKGRRRVEGRAREGGKEEVKGGKREGDEEEGRRCGRQLGGEGQEWRYRGVRVITV
jgi:hypothetical protein